MSEFTLRVLGMLGGAFLGSFFFGGLWWTVRHGLRSSMPAVWFLGSLLLRTGVVVAGICFISRGDWRQLIASLLGFFIARAGVLRASRAFAEAVEAQPARPSS